MAHWLEILFITPKSLMLVILVIRSLGDSLMRLSIRRAMMVATRFSFYFGNSAIPNRTSFCSIPLTGKRVENVLFKEPFEEVMTKAHLIFRNGIEQHDNLDCVQVQL